MAPYVNKTFQKEYKDAFTEYLIFKNEAPREVVENSVIQYFEELPSLQNTERHFGNNGPYCREDLYGAHEYAAERAMRRTDRACYQAMEALVHNFNTLHSRAGAQVN